MNAPIKLYNITPDGFSGLLPENAPYCSRGEIAQLHKETCQLLGIERLYPKILWSFSMHMRNAVGEACWWFDDLDKKQWRIQYCTKSWIALGAAGRRNTIVHEICHLAVEKIYGHNARRRKDQECVTDHGKHWQDLMEKCGEDPFMDVEYVYR